MAISFIGANSASSSTVSISAVSWAAGDLAILQGYNGASSTIPTLPTGWTNISSQSDGTGVQGWRAAFRILQAGDSTTLGMTNAQTMNVAVYRGASGIGGHGSVVNTSGTTDSVPGLTMSVTDGSSWAASYSSCKANTTMSDPTSMTNRASVGDGVHGTAMHIWDSNSGVVSWGSRSSTLGTAAVSVSGSTELLATVVATGSDPLGLMLLGVG